MENLLCDINSLDDVNKIGAKPARIASDSSANQRNDSLAGDEVEGQKDDEKPLIDDWRNEVLSSETRIDLPPLKPIVSPILNGGETMILFARTGMGKSWFALEMAKAISEGEMFLKRYPVENPRRVLYIDGEMGIRTLQTRLDKLKIRNQFFRFRTCDFPLTCKALDFARTEFQNRLIQYIGGFNSEVVFLDNLATLYITDKTNQQESWAIMQNFILRLRNTGLAVVIVDHAGKGEGGGPRGTSAKTDIMQTVIELQKPASYTDEQGARFNVFFRKHRNFFKDDAKPFEAWLKDDGWEINDVEPENTDTGPNGAKLKETAFSMFDEGKTVQDVLGILGGSQSTVYRWYGDWKKISDGEN